MNSTYDPNSFFGINTPSKCPSKTDLITIVDPEVEKKHIENPDDISLPD